MARRQRLGRNRASARVQRDIGNGNDGQGSFGRQERHAEHCPLRLSFGRRMREPRPSAPEVKRAGSREPSSVEWPPKLFFVLERAPPRKRVGVTTVPGALTLRAVAVPNRTAARDRMYKYLSDNSLIKTVFDETASLPRRGQSLRERATEAAGRPSNGTKS